jgi:hypothetical protein
MKISTFLLICSAVILLFLNLATTQSGTGDSFQDIIDVNPQIGIQNSDVWVTITGSDTHFGLGSNIMIWFQQGSGTHEYADQVNVNSITQVDALFSFEQTNPTGYYDLYVDDMVDPILTMYSAFYLYPYNGEIIAVVPDEAQRSQNLVVAITGSGTSFVPGSGGTATVTLRHGPDHITAGFVPVYSSEFLEAYLQIPSDAYLGLWDVEVLNYNNPFPVVLEDGFRIMSDTAAIVMVDPDSAYRCDQLSVAITGQGTHFTQGSMSQIAFRQGSATINYESYQVSTPERLNAIFSIPNYLGVWELWVSSPFETVRLVDAFRVLHHCGDTNADCVVNVSDAIYAISYIFNGGPAPDPMIAGEVNCDGSVNLSDVVYIINYVFHDNAPAPCDPDNDGSPDC